MGKGELMNTRAIGTERALAELACAPLASHDRARVLIGGLGMGFTLAAALEMLGPNAEVVVAELVPEVVEWNRKHVGDAADHPLRDPRTAVHVGDVAEQVRDPGSGFDAIMLDVDNGPEAILRRENNWLYGAAGLAAMRAALRPGGTLAIWSAGRTARSRSVCGARGSGSVNMPCAPTAPRTARARGHAITPGSRTDPGHARDRAGLKTERPAMAAGEAYQLRLARAPDHRAHISQR